MRAFSHVRGERGKKSVSPFDEVLARVDPPGDAVYEESTMGSA